MISIAHTQSFLPLSWGGLPLAQNSSAQDNMDYCAALSVLG